MLFGCLGATPVGMPVPAVPIDLSRGVTDGAVIPWEVTGALRVPDLMENHTEFGDVARDATAFLFAMNRDRDEALRGTLPAVIDAYSVIEFSGIAGRRMQIDDGPARAVATARATRSSFSAPTRSRSGRRRAGRLWRTGLRRWTNPGSTAAVSLPGRRRFWGTTEHIPRNSEADEWI